MKKIERLFPKMSEFAKRFPKPKDSASVESLYWEKRRQGWFEALLFVRINFMEDNLYHIIDDEIDFVRVEIKNDNSTSISGNSQK